MRENENERMKRGESQGRGRCFFGVFSSCSPSLFASKYSFFLVFVPGTTKNNNFSPLSFE